MPSGTHSAHPYIRILLRVDFRNVDRTSIYLPAITIRGLLDNPLNPADPHFVQLSTVTGILSGSSPSSLSTFWEKMQAFFKDLFGTDSSTSNDMNKNNSDIKEFNEIISDGFDKPDPNDFTPEQNLQQSGASFDSFANFFLAVMENPFIYYGIFLSITLSVAGVLLYGKR